MELTVLCWNLFHGRDFPPDPELRTWRSRLLRLDESNETHVQVNRDLTAEFATLLSSAAWDVAMLQECPPRFAAPLARASGAEYHRVFTSRNELGFWRAFLARQNPDLIASNEGGSNLILVRGRIEQRRELELTPGPRPERRAMAFARAVVDGELICVANLHASAHQPELTAEDVLRAAVAADEWAGEAPLIFGGDLNLRPQESPAAFAELRERFGLAAPTAPRAIDHLLVRDLGVVEPPHQWPPERRELSEDERALRLSDHTPVEARFALPTPR